MEARLRACERRRDGGGGRLHFTLRDRGGWGRDGLGSRSLLSWRNRVVRGARCGGGGHRRLPARGGHELHRDSARVEVRGHRRSKRVCFFLRLRGIFSNFFFCFGLASRSIDRIISIKHRSRLIHVLLLQFELHERRSATTTKGKEKAKGLLRVGGLGAEGNRRRPLRAREVPVVDVMRLDRLARNADRVENATGGCQGELRDWLLLGLDDDG